MPLTIDVLPGLTERQDRLVILLDRVAELLPVATDENARAIAAVRWQLVRVVLDYQMFKHRCVFDPVLAAGDPARVAVARRLKERCLATAAQFKAHVAQWSPTASLGAWAGYRAAEAAMIARLRAQVVDERAAAPALLAPSRVGPPPSQLATPRPLAG